MRSIVPLSETSKAGLNNNNIALLSGKKTTMGPNSGTPIVSQLGVVYDAVGIDAEGDTPKGHPEEPLVYRIPDQLYSTYRPLPIISQAAIYLLSIWISAISTWKNLTFLQPLAILRGWREPASPGQLFSFVVKSAFISLILYMPLQDIFLPPSRISTSDLSDRFYLPSALSKYEKIKVVDQSGAARDVGVHYLKYSSKDQTRAGPYGAVYVHHGFGASSLSWLPALPSLVNRLGARCGLGHDMVGFGFTDRPDELEWYTTDASAGISQSIFEKETYVDGQPFQSVALLGHSLGAIGVLKMALKLPLNLSKVIILSSPGLGQMSRLPAQPDTDALLSRLQRMKIKISSLLARFLLFPISGYVLRRLVGLENFWRSGLRLAWGDPNILKDSDVLRYQWPSIGKGWERGLLKFASAQRRLDDIALLHQVLNLPNTTVAVIVGTKDRVIPPSTTKRFLANFQPGQVPLIELEGLGHDAFEENVDRFMDAVEAIVRGHGAFEPSD